MRLGDTRRQMHVAHLPAGRDPAAVVDADHVVAPRVGARVAALAQPCRVPGLRARRRVAVVPVDHREPALAQQRAALGLDFDAEARERVGIRQHVRLAGERRAPPGQRADNRPACARRRTGARGSTWRRASSRSARCSRTSAPVRRRRTGRTHCRNARRAAPADRGSASAPSMRRSRRRSRAAAGRTSRTARCGRQSWMGRGRQAGSRSQDRRMGSRCARPRDSAIMPPLGPPGNAQQRRAPHPLPGWRNW